MCQPYIKELLRIGGVPMAKAFYPTPPSIDTLRGLIIPQNEKPYWNAYANYLATLPLETWACLGGELLRWTQDLNWPGCEEILRKFNMLPPSIQQKAIHAAKTEALGTHDDEWLTNLNMLFCELPS